LRTANAQLLSAFTVSTTAGQIKGTSANLQVSGFVLTAGQVIHLDPYRTYLIPAETRLYKIRKESRLYTIDTETRIYKIRG
jgi:hypothetical protein